MACDCDLTVFTDAELDLIKGWLLGTIEKLANAQTYSIAGRTLTRPSAKDVLDWLSAISRIKRLRSNENDRHGGADLVCFN